MTTCGDLKWRRLEVAWARRATWQSCAPRQRSPVPLSVSDAVAATRCLAGAWRARAAGQVRCGCWKATLQPMARAQRRGAGAAGPPAEAFKYGAAPVPASSNAYDSLGRYHSRPYELSSTLRSVNTAKAYREHTRSRGGSTVVKNLKQLLANRVHHYAGSEGDAMAPELKRPPPKVSRPVRPQELLVSCLRRRVRCCRPTAAGAAGMPRQRLCLTRANSCLLPAPRAPPADS